MRNLFKKLLFCGALAVSGGAFAGPPAGPLDGVYLCNTTVPGVGVMTTYNAVLTNAQGVTGFSVMNVSPGTQASGYGLGTATATTFSGTDSNGKPFAFTATGATMTGTGFFQVGAVSLASTSVCSKIW
jgi:hypothetical protein